MAEESRASPAVLLSSDAWSSAPFVCYRFVFHDGAHDPLLGGVSRGELADEAAFVHHVDPVAGAEQFGHFGRDHHDAFAGGHDIVDDAVDLVFGADVDAPGRL